MVAVVELVAGWHWWFQIIFDICFPSDYHKVSPTSQWGFISLHPKTGWSFRRGFVLLAANRLKEMLPSMTSTSDLHIAVPTVVWACARLGVQHDLLLAVAQHLGSKTKVSKLPDWGLCVLAWSFQVLEPELMDFEELLLTEINKRGFTDEKVEEEPARLLGVAGGVEEPEELEASE